MCSSHRYLEMLDNVDHLSGGVGVGDGALVGHGAQLSEGGDQLLQRGVGNVWSVLFEHGQLGLRLRVVHGVAAEDVACSQETGSKALLSAASPDLSWISDNQILNFLEP